MRQGKPGCQPDPRGRYPRRVLPKGIAALISQSILLVNIIKWAGAAYLSFVGTKYLSAKRLNSEETDVV
jgi:arginine exporter protein ArgO